MKTTRLSFMLVGLILLMTSNGCATSTPSLTTYEPQEGSPYKITFTYPSEWNWASPSSDLMMVDIYPNSRKARIWIYINVNVTDTPETDISNRINLYMETNTEISQFKLLEDRKLEINRHQARWFVTQVVGTNRVSPDEPYIAEDIFLLSKDRFYIIGIQYTLSETNSQFYDEFQAMIASIKFLP